MVIVEPNSPITPENVVAKLSQSKLDKIAELKAKLVRIDEDIAQLNKSIELQEARKDKMAMPYEKEEIDQVIDSMIDQVAELQGKQENIHKKLKIMNTPNQPSGKNSKITTIKPRTVNPAISGLTSHLRTLETNAKTKFPSNPAVKELGRLLDIGSTEALAEIDHKDLEAKVITLLDLRFLGVSKEIKKKLIAWLNEVPYSVKAYITGFKFLDKQKPPSYFSLNGMIVLTPGSINRITLFHEIHHGIMTEMFNNFSFDYFQYYVDHTEIDLGLGNIKKLFRTTAIEHSIMDNTSIDSWLYTHNKVYKETVEGMSERFAEYIIGKGRGSEPDHVEFFNKFFPKDTQLTVQPEVSHEKVDGYDIMTDEQGRNIICE